MYLSHWGLARAPFQGAHARDFFYQGETQTEALSRLRFLVQQRRSGGLVTGVRGSGKSLLLAQFGEACRQQGYEVARVSLAGVEPPELYWDLAWQWDAHPGGTDDATRLARRLQDFARSFEQRPAQAVLLVDDLDAASADATQSLLRLLGFAYPQAWCTLIAACETNAAERLEPMLVDKLDLHIELEPWDAQESAACLQFGLFEAGSDRPLFDDDSLALLHELSGGVPRQVCRLADCALAAAAAFGRERVDAAAVEAALATR